MGPLYALFLAVSLLMLAPGSVAGQTGGWKTVASYDGTYSYQVPNSWKPDSGGATPGNAKDSPDRKSVMLVFPPNTAYDLPDRDANWRMHVDGTLK